MPFGERLCGRSQDHSSTSSRSTGGYGIYLGRAANNDEHILGTRVGVIRARTVRTLVEGSCYDAPWILCLRCVPWAPVSYPQLTLPTTTQL